MAVLPAHEEWMTGRLVYRDAFWELDQRACATRCWPSWRRRSPDVSRVLLRKSCRTDVRSGAYHGGMPTFVAPARLAGTGAPARRARLGADGAELAARHLPPEYRAYPALRRHVVVLARFAVLHVEASQPPRGAGSRRPGRSCGTWPRSTSWRPPS